MAARGAPKPVVIGFVAPLSGPLQERSEEYLAGVRQAAAFWSGSDAIGGSELQIVMLEDAKSYKAVSARLKKEKIKLAAILGVPSASELEAFTKFARKKKKPFILLPPWEPLYGLDEKETLHHLSCGSVDHAVAAASYSMIPMRATKVVAFHDGSAPSKALADAYVRNLPRRIKEGRAQAIPPTVREVRELLGKFRWTGSI